MGALSDSAEGFTKLVHHPGHNGEATLASIFKQCGTDCVGHTSIPRVSLDASWPVLRAGVMEILKLSVNSEELDTMRGARSLLSKRQVCTVMMHVGKVQLGWQDHSIHSWVEQGDGQNLSTFSTELWSLFQDGAIDLALHLDIDVTGQIKGDPRPRPDTTMLNSPAELDAVFQAPVFAHDYLVARQREDADSPCQGSHALRHFNSMFKVFSDGQ